MRPSLVCTILVLAACGRHHVGGAPDAAIDAPAAPCTDLVCFQVDCGPKGLPPTSISGTVFAPNGTLPLFGVNVYVPSVDPGPVMPNVQCDQCGLGLPGTPLVQTTTDEAGHFTLPDVPATTNVPIMISVGKWRRQFTVANVAACQDTPITMANTTLPKSVTDMTPETTRVDLPQIAISTGSADALECLLLKLGVDPTEITNDTGAGHVHLFTNNGSAGQGAKAFAATWPGGPGATFGDSETMWSTIDTLRPYDIVMLSCEGDQFPLTKPQTALQALHDYAGIGGRVFMSHWHNIWVAGENGNAAHGLPDWEALATFDFGAAQNEASQLTIIDETVPKGTSFATWLLNVGASTTRDQLTVNEPRYTCQKNNDPMTSDRMVYVDPLLSTPLGKQSVQDLQFTTPVDMPPEQRCGKVVFSDMHVSSGSTSKVGVPYPGGCAMTDLSPQEKALAFIFFDIASCVGPIQ